MLHPVPYTRQPQVPVTVNWGNPITYKLAIALNVAGEKELVSGAMPVLSGSSLRSANGWGKTFKAPDTQIPGAFTYTIKLAASFDCTMLVLQRCTTNDTAGLETIHLNSAEPVLFSNTGNQSQFFTTGNGSAIITVINGALNNLIGIKRVNSQESYLNGVLKDTSVTGNRQVEAITSLSIGRSNGGNNLVPAEYSLVLYWQRALTLAEVRAVSLNPWQLFTVAPASYWSPVAATPFSPKPATIKLQAVQTAANY